MPDLSGIIETKLKKINIVTDSEKIHKLNDYINLLDKWNKAYNLTAVRNIHQMLDRHLMDSLSIEPYLFGKHFIDVGTGPGLPGIPLAILHPENHYTLLDSNGKKTRFLQQVKIELTLDNIEVVNSRVEDYHPDKKFEGVLSRAFATLLDMLKGANHLCDENGTYFAMKGQYPERELQEIVKPFNVQAITWPGLDEERHLVIISQSERS